MGRSEDTKPMELLMLDQNEDDCYDVNYSSLLFFKSGLQLATVNQMHSDLSGILMQSWTAQLQRIVIGVEDCVTEQCGHD